MKELLNSKQFVISNILIKELLKLKLSLSEFLLILYFVNEDNKIFDIDDIQNKLGMREEDILEAFNNLTTKQLINLETKEINGQINETISLEGIFNSISSYIAEEESKKQQSNVFDMIETEFSRSLSPIEYEIVNAWLASGVSEELIIGALKEAIYNGVKNFRYIDKIIYEWGKKGFKTMDDVKAHLKNRDKKEETKELFDYDWLDDDEV